MKPMEKRVRALEDVAGHGDDRSITSIWHNVIAPDDKANGRPNGWLGVITICSEDGSSSERFSRGDDEDKAAFIERAAEGFRAMHGALPDGWGQDNEAA